MADTVTLGRSKRATAGNRMRELLEKAHQEDEDELFKEVEDDEEFSAPQEARDVFLEDFADTDDEVEMDEEELERQIRREERRKAKGKGKAIYDPFGAKSSAQPKHKPILASTSSPNTMSMEEELSLLDPNLDTSNMAPSTLILTLRTKRREAMRVNRSEARRSNLRASTLKTEEEVIAREAEAKELRRVGRKRVRGPRWTWISRTVGKMVEIVENDTLEPASAVVKAASSQEAIIDDRPKTLQTPGSQEQEIAIVSPKNPTASLSTIVNTDPAVQSTAIPLPIEAGPSTPPTLNKQSATDNPENPSQYTRNYLILSEIPGGLSSELAIILGEHTEWDQLQYIPARNRPLNRKPLTCPFTGLPAKYKHPATGIPYASVEGYRIVEGLVQNRYVYSEDMGWVGAEEEDAADGVEEIEGWMESIWDGWMGGNRIPEEEENVEMHELDVEEEVVEDEILGEEERQGQEALAPSSNDKKRKASSAKEKKGAKYKVASSSKKKVKKR